MIATTFVKLTLESMIIQTLEGHKVNKTERGN